MKIGHVDRRRRRNASSVDLQVEAPPEVRYVADISGERGRASLALDLVVDVDNKRVVRVMQCLAMQVFGDIAVEEDEPVEVVVAHVRSEARLVSPLLVVH